MDANFGLNNSSRIQNPYEKERGSRMYYYIIGLLLFGLAASVYFFLGARLDFNTLVSSKEHDFSALYTKYGVGPIPASALNSEVNKSLGKLERESCLWDAMRDLGKALVEQSENRAAAGLYLGFAKQCGDNDVAEREAAVVYYQLNDFQAARLHYANLVEKYPDNDLDWYHKGEAEAKLKLHDQALDSYATMISLTSNKENLGEWVFYEMAQIYAAQNRFCEAMSQIDTYISLDPKERQNSKTQQMLLNYSKKGNCVSYASGSASFPVFVQDVITVRATINGVSGSFAIDTGASFVAVTSEFAKRANIQAGSEIQTSTANGDTAAKLSKASSITLGTLRSNDVALVIISKPIGKLDGLLGRSFLARYDMKFGQQKLTLSAKDDGTQRKDQENEASVRSGSHYDAPLTPALAPPVVTPPTTEPYASRLWEVQLMKIPNGQMWCEAHTRGQNDAGGGDYMVHMFVNGKTPTLVIDHEGGSIQGAVEAEFRINDEFVFMNIPIEQSKHGSKKAIYIKMKSLADFQNKFIPNLENSESHTLVIKVGSRKYLTVVEGFAAVSEKMGRCHELYDERSAKR